MASVGLGTGLRAWLTGYNEAKDLDIKRKREEALQRQYDLQNDWTAAVQPARIGADNAASAFNAWQSGQNLEIGQAEAPARLADAGTKLGQVEDAEQQRMMLRQWDNVNRLTEGDIRAITAPYAFGNDSSRATRYLQGQGIIGSGSKIVYTEGTGKPIVLQESGASVPLDTYLSDIKSRANPRADPNLEFKKREAQAKAIEAEQQRRFRAEQNRLERENKIQVAKERAAGGLGDDDPIAAADDYLAQFDNGGQPPAAPAAPAISATPGYMPIATAAGPAPAQAVPAQVSPAPQQPAPMENIPDEIIVQGVEEARAANTLATLEQLYPGVIQRYAEIINARR